MSNTQTKFPNTMLQFAKHFFKPYRNYLICMIVITILVAAYTALDPYIIKKFIDAATPVLGTQNLAHAALLPAIMWVALNIFTSLIWRLYNYVQLKSMPGLKADIIDQASDYVHGHSYKFFQDSMGGTISNKIADLASNAETLIANTIELFKSLLMILGAMVMSAVVSPIFSLLFFTWTILFMLAAFYFSKKIEPLSNDFASSRSNTIGRVVDSFTNAINVILFAREAYEKVYLRHSLNEMATKDINMQMQLMRYAFIMAGLAILVQGSTIVLLIYLGTNGTLTIGDFTLIFMLSTTILNQVWSFTQTLFKVAEQIGVFNQSLSSISIPHEIVDSEHAVPLKINNGTIVFDKVKFFYTEAHQLFEDKTLTIQAHEKVGLVGYSGSGKTTFVNLITRTFDIQGGDILLDNQSIHKVTLQSLRDNIAFIPQDPTLFHRSVMDNIRYGKLEATDEEVIEAAKKARVHEFAIELPQGYQTLVGERGVKLSGGQRQRIAIARAILKNAPILILDEATSSLDSMTEVLIQESLQIAMHKKTVIVIAHRLSTIKAMDRIFVFDSGKVVEEGTHEHLLDNGKIYQGLWQVQQGFLSH